MQRVQLIRDGAPAKDHEKWIPDLLKRGGVNTEQALQQALNAMDRLAVTTIHGFFKGVLEEFAFECGVPVGLTFLEDVSPYIETALADEWRAIAWAPGFESQLLFGGAVNLDHGTLIKQVKRVRGAIGAKRPVRVNRARLLEGTMAELDAVVKAFDAEQMRAYYDSIKWNKTAPKIEQIDELARAIAEHSPEKPLRIALIEPWTTAAVDKNASGVGKVNKSKALAEPFLATCDRAVETATVAAREFEQDVVLSIVERVERAMARDRVAGFDEQVGMLVSALEDPERGPVLRKVLAERYDAVLVDEFQDTDWAQWRIFAKTFSSHPLILVGDPKQSIYAFRGADITAYRAAREASDGRIFKLDTNYRSDAGLVNATEVIFTRNDAPFAVPKSTLDFDSVEAHRKTASLTDPLGRPLVLTAVGGTNNEVREAEAIRHTADEIARLLSDPAIQAKPSDDEPARPVRAKDIVVLVTANYMAAPLIRALKARGVPAISSATGDIADSQVWQDLLLIIDAIERPSDSRVVRRALATECGGWTAARLANLSSEHPEWQEVIDRLAQARRDWTYLGALGALTALAHDWRSIEHLATSGDGERHLTDLRHVVALLQQAESEGYHTPAQLRHWAKRFADSDYTTPDARQLHLESDREAVLIATIHAAKGLEWPIVFCPTLWKLKAREGELPRIARFEDGSRRVTFSEERIEGEIPEDQPLSENLRLTYVALTRAKWRTYVAVATNDNESVVHHLLGNTALADLANEHPQLIADGIKAGPFRGTVPKPTVVPNDIIARDVKIGYEQWQSWSVTSYTRLTSGLTHGDDAEEAPVLDAAEATADPTLVGSALPGGAHTGDALHALLEHLDFTKVGDATVIADAVEEMLRDYGLPTPTASDEAKRAAAEYVRVMVERTLIEPIPLAAAALSSVPKERSFREWRFQMPMEGISARAIASVLKQHGADWLQGYAASLDRTSQHALDGILTGIVDLVCVIDDRWWIIDWKSNTLGATASAYDDAGCRRAMMREHFVVQYHVYAVALHRFLRSRLGATYDYDQHFGGVGYAFLRGLALGAPAWFNDKPPRALVEALDAAIGGYAR